MTLSLIMGNTNLPFDSLYLSAPIVQNALSDNTETEGTFTATFAAGGAPPDVIAYWISQWDSPWQSPWPTGDITLEIDLNSGSVGVNGYFKVYRFDAAGNFKESVGYGSAISLRTAGTKSRTFSSVAWTAGTTNYGDRIVIELKISSTSSSYREVTIGMGTTNSQAIFSGLTQGAPGQQAMMGIAV